MTPQDKLDLRSLRDGTTDAEDKRLLRSAINYITKLEYRLNTVRTLLQSAIKETKSTQHAQDGGNGGNIHG